MATNPTAHEVYAQKREAIDAELMRILSALEARDKVIAQGERVTWASVGSLDHYLAQIKDVADSLNLTGEYAS